MPTLYDKLWEEHHIKTYESGESLIYIDRHYLHEVTSPQAFESIVKGKELPNAGVPESFNVLLHELNGLGLKVSFE